MSQDDVTEEPTLGGDVEPAATRLAEEIRRRRRAAELSHAQLAVRVGYSREYVRRAESPRKGLPSAGLVGAIDHALGAAGELLVLREQAEAVRRARRRPRKRSILTSLSTSVAVGGPGFVVDSERVGENEVAVQAPPGQFFAGTSIAARVFPASDSGRVLAAVPHRFAENPFLRRPRRGLIIGVAESEHGVDLYALDARQARRRLAGTPVDSQLLMSRAYVLDDLALGILWAVANLDEALLDDDATLSESIRQLAVYEQLPRSAASRDIATDLSAVSQMWLGSQFCARHIQRHKDALTDPPAFWTREQRGEEASTWLLFAHKYAYLRQSTGRAGGEGAVSTRAFCVPPAAVAASSRSERLLFLLSVSLMESFGIAVDVCIEPEYTAVPGFVFDGHRRAILANWVGADGIWQVDITDATPRLREFADATGYAHAHSIAVGEAPGARLRALADYLGLDWPWLVHRCRDLGEYGCAGIAQPRSRLLSTEGVDQACRFLARADSANQLA